MKQWMSKSLNKLLFDALAVERKLLAIHQASVEFGYICCERGMNLSEALALASSLLLGPGKPRHSEKDCPYLHVKDCAGCGRSCACYTSRPAQGHRRKKQKSIIKPKCTCDRTKHDMDPDEHLITCPSILTDEVRAHIFGGGKKK